MTDAMFTQTDFEVNAMTLQISPSGYLQYLYFIQLDFWVHKHVVMDISQGHLKSDGRKVHTFFIIIILMS